MTELEQNLNSIYEEKQTKIKPENIKEGVTILGIEGNYSGLDTSDATATESDISEGKTAYINGEKITGTLEANTNNATVVNYTGKQIGSYSKFKKIDLDCSNATNMYGAFAGQTLLEEVNLNNISNITNLSYAFQNCYGLKKITVNGNDSLDLTGVTDTSYMFAGCSQTIFPTSSINTQTVQNMSYMFDASHFATIPELDCSSCIKIDYCLTRSGGYLKNFGGFKDLGKAFTVQKRGNPDYWLTLTYTTGMTYESIMNIINKLYDLNITYDVANGGTLYEQRISLPNDITLTDEEKQIAIDKGWYFA